MKVQPLGDRVLIKHEKAADKIGSLFLPEQAKEKPVEATVIAIGEGKWNPINDGNVRSTHDPLPVSIGDRVLVSKYGGTEIKIDGEDFKLIQIDDILAKLNQKGKQ